jgi:hypothetical protein
MCLGGAGELGVLFSLSHEFRVSFVCSLALVYVFRGELVSLVRSFLYLMSLG